MQDKSRPRCPKKERNHKSRECEESDPLERKGGEEERERERGKQKVWEEKDERLGGLMNAFD
jgi:hypothetical protein